MLKNKTAIITGGGGVIGGAIAAALAKEGCNIILVDLLKPDLERIFNGSGKSGGELLAIAADACKREEADGVVSAALNKFSQIDILVNAAGIRGPIGAFGDNDMDRWIATININLVGTALFIKSVLPEMKKQKFGKIINFSGGGAFNPFPNFSAYSTSKAAVVRFTETLAEELKEYNIQVNAIAPGAVNTKMLEDVLEAGPQAAGTEFFEKSKKQKEDGGDSPQLAAELVSFLVSETAGALTGRTISAKWDDWRNWDAEKISQIMASDLYKMKRIV